MHCERLQNFQSRSNFSFLIFCSHSKQTKNSPNATMCFPGSVQVLQAVSANNANPGRHLLWLLNKIVTRTSILPCFETLKYPLNDENKRLSSTHGQPTEGDMIPHYLVFISTWRGPVSPPCPKCFHPSETKLLFTLRADSEHSSFLLHSSQTF